MNTGAFGERGRPACSGPEDGRGRLAGSDEDAPDDETVDEMPDAGETAALERQALAAEETQDVERLLDGIGRLPPDSKLDCLTRCPPGYFTSNRVSSFFGTAALARTT